MTYVVVVESHFSESNGAESEFGCPVSRISRNLGSWPSGISDFQDSWLAAHFFFTSSGCKMVYWMMEEKNLTRSTKTVLGCTSSKITKRK